MQTQLSAQDERLTQMSDEQQQWRQEMNNMMAQQAAMLTQQFAQEMQRMQQQIAAFKSSQSVQRSSSPSVHPPDNDNDGPHDGDDDDDNDTFDITTLDGSS